MNPWDTVVQFCLKRYNVLHFSRDGTPYFHTTTNCIYHQPVVWTYKENRGWLIERGIVFPKKKTRQKPGEKKARKIISLSFPVPVTPFRSLPVTSFPMTSQSYSQSSSNTTWMVTLYYFFQFVTRCNTLYNRSSSTYKTFFLASSQT